MKSTSNLMMGLTLVLVVCLAVVLGLVLVLLAELYCSVILRRRQLRDTSPNAATAEAVITVDNDLPPPAAAPPPSLSNFYAQGVLAAPRSLLYPAVSGNDIEKQQLPQPPENQEQHRGGHGCSGDSNRREEHLVYISNPVYDDENGRRSRAEHTPFETPDTSPSRLETEESSGDDEREEMTSLKVLITPMKKLPAEAVKDGGSMGTSVGDSNSNNGVSSSSSSGTPCTSVSW